MPVHIALTFDDNFWAPAYATMRSICIFSRRRGEIVFHLCHVGLSAAHRADLDRITSEYGAAVRYYDLSQTDYLSARIRNLPAIRTSRLTTIVYARLFLFEILPKDVGRIIYIDCDMFVRTDIATLYDMDLGGNIAAAVLDPYRSAFQLQREGRAKAYFDAADPYFNGGVILFGPECADIDFVAEVLKLVPADAVDSLYLDQDMLNLVLKDRWLVLPHPWNFQNPLPGDERLDPLIVHYTGPNKPWQIRTRTVFKRLYRHVMTNELFNRYCRHRYRRRLNGLLARLSLGLWHAG